MRSRLLRSRRRLVPRFLRSFWRNDRGENIIEFAVVSIVFLTLTMAVVEFGEALWIYDTCAHLAREGARYGIAHGESSGNSPAQQASAIQTYLQNLAPGIGSQVSITTTWWSGQTQLTGALATDDAPGNVVGVTVSEPFNLAGGTLSSQTITLSSTSRLVISY